MIEAQRKFWIGVASKDHVANGVTLGICQFCHGKAAPAKRLTKGDIVIYYSPKHTMGEQEPYQKFTAIGIVSDEDIHAIAIDSTGLKRFGRGECHQEKYELSSKASWRKLHLAINQDHYIEACVLTDRFSHDDQQVASLLEQIDAPIDHFSGDGAYDETPVYAAVIEHSPNADVVIPPRSNAVEGDKSSPQRNRNIVEIEMHGRMQWQKIREYGRRNYSELGVQRYQQTFGDAMHARDFPRQQQEAMIASGALNKMTSLGMPQSRRSA